MLHRKVLKNFLIIAFASLCLGNAYSRTPEKCSKIALNAGFIVDTAFFRAIDSLMSFNPLYSDPDRSVIKLQFYTYTGNKNDYFKEITDKKDLYGSYIVSIRMDSSFIDGYHTENVGIVVRYHNRYFILPIIADSIIVRNDKKQDYPIKRTFIELQETPLIKCNNGHFELIDKKSKMYLDFHE